MTARKDRPVLYEMVAGERTGYAGTLAGKLRSSETRTPGRARAGRRRHLQARSGAAPRRSRLAPAVRYHAGRFVIRTGWYGIGGTLAGLIIALLLAYEVGARTAARPAAAADGLSEILAQPPDPSVLIVPESERRAGGRRIAPPADAPEAAVAAADPDEKPATGESTSAARPVVRQKGRHYVVVQHFPPARLRDAEAAAEFLSSRGVACGVVSEGADVRVVALDGFLIDQEDPAASRAEQRRCDELKAEIRRLGKEYARTAGYAFEQCRERKY